MQFILISERERLETGAFDLQYFQIGIAIHANPFGVESTSVAALLQRSRTVEQFNLNFTSARDDVRICDDVAIGRDNDASARGLLPGEQTLGVLKIERAGLQSLSFGN